MQTHTFSNSGDYNLNIEEEVTNKTEHLYNSQELPVRSNGHNVRSHPRNRARGSKRMSTNERNLISLRYRADSMADSVASQHQTDTETKVWNNLESIFCFLQGMTIYQSRKRLKAIIIAQVSINTIRIFPIILGLSYQTTVPLFILYITLIFGWHGTKFLVPRFLLFYKFGMQMTVLVDAIWYFRGYNGNRIDGDVSKGTALFMQGGASALLIILNLWGLLFGWKLRRLVKGVQNQREYDRAAMATRMPEPEQRQISAVSGIQQLRGTLTSRVTFSENIGEVVIAPETVRRSFTIAGNQGSNVLNKRASEISSSFISNHICTSKYTLYNFPFVFSKMQFSRLANIYTTIIVGLCFFSFSPVSPVASFTPLLIVFASSALKDVSEDLRRQRADTEVNSKNARIVRWDNTRHQAIEKKNAQWQDVQVGDLLILRDGEDVPADCILLTSSRPDGRVYVETANLDGETNLKIRTVASCTKHCTSAADILDQYKLDVDCDHPSKDLFNFDGVLRIEKKNASGESESYTPPIMLEPIIPISTPVIRDEPLELETSLTMDHLILRGSECRNAEWTIGLVIYTGKETKISLNSIAVPLKRSFVERTLDTMFVLVLVMLFSISVSCSLGNNNWDFDLHNKNGTDTTLDYLRPWYIGVSTGQEFIFLSYVILFNNLIPLSMYVTMEGVRFIHARYIESDLNMYDRKTDTPAQVRNSNINEDLGQIQYIFSDKTGTLTRNEMVFAKCTIAGLRYNDTEVREQSDSFQSPGQEDLKSKRLHQRPGTKFNDARLITRLVTNHSTAEEIHHFLLLLTICNTVIPQYDDAFSEVRDGESRHTNSSSVVRYNAASPDEQALVLAAKDLGYVLAARDGNICHTEIRGELMTFEILNVLEFNSDRKRMSVIVRFSTGEIILYCKGADDIIFDLLSTSQPQGVAHVTRGHLQEYASEGLRTLTIAMRRLSELEYRSWQETYRSAELSVDNRAVKIANASAAIEKELTLLGATAIEDRLQEGVEESICALRKAGINFWVLTGDKKETAISIGMSSRVIEDDMDVIVLGQRDKSSLRAKLEELYLELVVDDKWQDDEHASALKVVLGAVNRTVRLCFRMTQQMFLGRHQREETKSRTRRRVLKRQNQMSPSAINQHLPPTNVENSSTHEHTPKSGFAPFDEVYNPMLTQFTSDDSTDRSIGDREFEPKNLPRLSDRISNSSADDFTDGDLDFAMVIDGRTLALLLDDDIKYLFLAVAKKCKSVICCRCSPDQKACVVKLVTEPTLMFSSGNISLAIGDGANDVAMIQAANVGVGISGKEGRQAVLCSDFAIAEFRFLTRLLLVHGNYSYKRISKLILFSFMKNVALSMSNFFLAAHTMYSGVLMYFGVFFTLYNALFTTIPIVFISMYNQDVSPIVLMQYPTLYANGLQNRSFNWMTFFGWCILGVWHAYVIFVIPFDFTSSNTSSAHHDYVAVNSIHNDFGFWGQGLTAYSYLIVASTAQVALMTSNWTKANVVSTLGTLCFYFIFTTFFSNIYGYTEKELYEIENAYDVWNHIIVSPWFWLGMLMATVVSVFPNYVVKAGHVLFYPEPSHLMREWNGLAGSRKNLGVDQAVASAPSTPRLVRQTTGFAFSHFEGEGEMAMNARSQPNSMSRSPTRSGSALIGSRQGIAPAHREVHYDFSTQSPSNQSQATNNLLVHAKE